MTRSNGIKSFLSPVFLLLLLGLLSLIPACAKNNEGWTSSDREAANHYYASQKDNREATRIAAHAGAVFTEKQKADVRVLTAKALAEARMVPDAFMDKVHPQFKEHYRNEFQQACELAIRNLNHPDYNTAKKSSDLFSAFVDWFNENRAKMRMPE